MRNPTLLIGSVFMASGLCVRISMPKSTWQLWPKVAVIFMLFPIRALIISVVAHWRRMKRSFGGMALMTQ